MCTLTGQSGRTGTRTGWALVSGVWSDNAGFIGRCIRSGILAPADASAPWRGVLNLSGTSSARWRDTPSVRGHRKGLRATIFLVITHGSLRRCAPSDTPARAAASAPSRTVSHTSSTCIRTARCRGTLPPCARSISLRMGSSSSAGRKTTSRGSGTPRPEPRCEALWECVEGGEVAKLWFGLWSEGGRSWRLAREAVPSFYQEGLT